MRIEPSENLMTGRWCLCDGRMVADRTCERIRELVDSHLQLLGQDASGWDSLYRDPVDGRHWELVHPESGLHGGGPPVLRCLSVVKAKQKYGSTVPEL
jgi:hypothetical protein